MATATAKNVGKVIQVIGSTFDVEFAEDQLPSIYNAVKIVSDERSVKVNLTGEVQQQLGGGRVRCVALGAIRGPLGTEAIHRRSAPSGQRIAWRDGSEHDVDASLHGEQLE